MNKRNFLQRLEKEAKQLVKRVADADYWIGIYYMNDIYDWNPAKDQNAGLESQRNVWE